MKLTETMQQAVDYANKNGGILLRHPGGYWAREGWTQDEHPWFGTSTVNGLVMRGAAQYTEHRTGRNGTFPVKVQMASNAGVTGAELAKRPR